MLRPRMEAMRATPRLAVPWHDGRGDCLKCSGAHSVVHGVRFRCLGSTGVFWLSSKAAKNSCPFCILSALAINNERYRSPRRPVPSSSSSISVRSSCIPSAGAFRCGAWYCFPSRQCDVIARVVSRSPVQTPSCRPRLRQSRPRPDHTPRRALRWW